jgi:ABC-type sugar transport system ATPase subunit
MQSANTDQPLLEMNGIAKRYGGVQALAGVDIKVFSGEVHAVVGENGAGKSTLINVLGGIVRRDEGNIHFNGQEVDFTAPMQAIEAGIAIIHQELSMLPDLNVIENVFMGRMPTSLGRIRWAKLEAETRRVTEMVGLDLDPYAEVSSLSISQRQLIEISKAVSINAQLIVMDEPNSSLTERETEKLFEVIETLKAQGVAVIFISHKIDEVLHISDRISVLRDGQYVGGLETAEADADMVIRMMVGRELSREKIHHGHSIGEVLLEVRELSGKSFNKVSFSVRKGEIVGFAGLVGAGRSDVARAIFGADPYHSGEIKLAGEKLRCASPAQAIKQGIAMLPEDRKNLSLFMELPIRFNMSIAKLPHHDLNRGGLIRQQRLDHMVNNYLDKLRIKVGQLSDPVSSLSGGNQQKTILSRWLSLDPRLLILDEPTHGVDVGAKAEIYKLMHSLSMEGISIILISSELNEVMMMSDQVVVMREGKVTAVLGESELNEDLIMACATYEDHHSANSCLEQEPAGA